MDVKVTEKTINLLEDAVSATPTDLSLLCISLFEAHCHGHTKTSLYKTAASLYVQKVGYESNINTPFLKGRPS